MDMVCCIVGCRVEQVKEVEPNCMIILCGTKLDLVIKGPNNSNPTPRAVSADEVKQFAANIGAKQFETSSRTDVNVQLPFNTIAQEWLALPKKPPETGKFQLLTNDFEKNPKRAQSKNACCNQ